MKKIIILLLAVFIFAENFHKKSTYYYNIGEFKKATIYYSKSCKRNNYKDCIKAGDMYNYAKGITLNYHKAYNFYLKACNHKFYKGCENIGILFYNGTGVRKNYSKALYFLKKACFHNVATACCIVGNYYAYHTRKYKNAILFYKKACQKGDILGCFAKNKKSW